MNLNDNCFIKSNNINERKKLAKNILETKGFYPVIIQNLNYINCKNMYYSLKIDGENLIQNLSNIINHKENISNNYYLSFFIIFDDNKILWNNQLKIKKLYKKYKEEDEILYIFYDKLLNNNL